MFKLIIRIDKYVIKVGGIEVVQVFKEYIIYISLVRSQAISKPKGKDFVLIASVAYIESHKLFRLRIYLYIVKYLPDIELYINIGLAKLG